MSPSLLCGETVQGKRKQHGKGILWEQQTLCHAQGLKERPQQATGNRLTAGRMKNGSVCSVLLETLLKMNVWGS